MTKIVSNITIVMNDQRPAPAPCGMTKDTPELAQARELLDHAIAHRSVTLLRFGDLQAAHERVMLLRTIIADLEAGA